jgi:hypothetical protein
MEKRQKRHKTILIILRPNYYVIVLPWYILQKKLEKCTVWQEFGRHMIITLYGKDLNSSTTHFLAYGHV